MRVLTVGKIKRFRYALSPVCPGWTGDLWWALVDLNHRPRPYQVIRGFLAVLSVSREVIPLDWSIK